MPTKLRVLDLCYLSEIRLPINAAFGKVTHTPWRKKPKSSVFTKPPIQTTLPAIRKSQTRQIWKSRCDYVVYFENQAHTMSKSSIRILEVQRKII